LTLAAPFETLESMAHYAILSPAFIGHLNPMIVLARALQRRGHRVSFLAPVDAKAKVERAGLDFIPVCSEEFPAGEWDRYTSTLGELTGIKANRFAGNWIGAIARGFIRELPEIFHAQKFDGLVMDQIAIGAESVAAVHKVPLALACCALAANPEWTIPPSLFHWNYSRSLAARFRNVIAYSVASLNGLSVMRAIMPYRRKHRLGLIHVNHMNHSRPSLVQVTQQPRFFDFPRDYLPKNFHYTGPFLEPAATQEGDFPWERLDGRPIIYASLGTLQNRLQHVFKMIAEACSTFDLQLVVALGNKNATPPPNLAGNPIVVGYAPQAALLKRAHLVITHCGLNTTLETLTQGLPMVGLPITNDQPGVATRVEHLGAGIKIPIHQLTTERLRDAIQQIQSNNRYRARARELADEIARVDGPGLAAELIETAFVTRQPVTSRPQRNSLAAV
jgi:zeaxanthin glucosyltransferase